MRRRRIAHGLAEGWRISLLPLVLVALSADLAGGSAPLAVVTRPAATLPNQVSAADDTTEVSSLGEPTPAQLVGQKLVVAMSGTTPSAALLGRVRRGEVGGVILFGSNITTAGALRSLTTSLQAAAFAGGQPPLLISTDQEGGLVKRVAWAPPTLAPPEIAQLGSPATAEEQGLATGYVLRCAGVNSNLAPVADVPRSTSAFMYERGRTWSFDAGLTATLARAFAAGLEAGGTVPAMKHFPGIGFATQNTDDFPVTITATREQLAPELLPYQAAIEDGIPMIMLSNATYTAYDTANGAGWSPAVADLLRGELGFGGVTITDSLSGTAKARGVSAVSLARKAAIAGTDMILLTGSESGTSAAYARLLEDAVAGTIPVATLQASYERILALKASIAAPVNDVAAPTVSAPVSRLVARATLGSNTVRVRTAWSAADPCAISAYRVGRRVDGSRWADQPLSAPLATSIRQMWRLSSTYRYRAEAVDGAGNASDRAKGPFMRAILRESSRADVTYSGAWSRAEGSRFSGGATRHASAAGASAGYAFRGTSVAWVAAVGPGRGSAEVYIDGELRTTVSLHAPSSATRQVVFAASWPVQDEHVIEIVVLGTPGHPRVDVDAFVHLRAT